MINPRNALPIIFLFANANSLTPILCHFEIVNAFVERYPKVEGKSQKYFIENKSIFKIQSTELLFDSSNQTYEARVTINEKSLNCKNRTKRSLFISKSCQTIMIDKKQYLIPEKIRYELARIPRQVLKDINLISCIDKNKKTYK